MSPVFFCFQSVRNNDFCHNVSSTTAEDKVMEIIQTAEPGTNCLGFFSSKKVPETDTSESLLS
jgi:hypothetical protein